MPLIIEILAYVAFVILVFVIPFIQILLIKPTKIPDFYYDEHNRIRVQYLCESCRNVVDKDAEVCPHCNKKFKKY